MTVRCSVLGASGYSGGETLRLLAGHPHLTPAAVSAHSRAGETVSELHPNLTHLDDLKTLSLEEALAADVDVVFSCLPHGELGRVASEGTLPERVVDLSEDFRADPAWCYGLTELAREEVAVSPHVANPGCYPSATLLAVVPFARAGVITGPIVVDAISGTSGAGRKAEDRLSFAQLDGGVSAYGTTTHHHIAEIERGIARFAGIDATVSFTPHLAPMARGLLATVRAPLAGKHDDGSVLNVLREAYAGEAFITVTEDWPRTKAVAGSNRAQLTARVDARAGLLVASCAIDNLGKGAAGQAIQNVNLMNGWGESTGLEAAGVWP